MWVTIIIQFTKLQHENKKMKEEIAKLKGGTNDNEISKNIIKNNNINSNNKIIVNNFGNENIKYITDKNIHCIKKYIIKLVHV